MKNFDEENFMASLNVLLSIVENYLLFPGKVENWVVIIDINK